MRQRHRVYPSGTAIGSTCGWTLGRHHGSDTELTGVRTAGANGKAATVKWQRRQGAARLPEVVPARAARLQPHLQLRISCG